MIPLATLDFETFFDPVNKYGLRSMTALEYVFDPRFEIILVSYKVDDGQTRWFSGTEAETRQWLLDQGIEEHAVLGHNLSEFDALILARLGLRPKRYFCTLQMARVLGIADLVGGSLASLAKHFGLRSKGDEVVNAQGLRRADFTPEHLQRYAEYCCLDTDLCYELWGIMSPLVPAGEWPIMDLHTKAMATLPLRFDAPLAKEYLASLVDERERCIADLGVAEADIMSNPKLAKLLEGLGVAPPMKKSARTGKMTFAFGKTDEAFTDLLEHPDPDVSNLVATRLKIKSTIEHTRTSRFIDTATRLGGRMCMPVRYSAAHTGRSGGTMKINMQNLSARKRAPVLKRTLLAPPGHDVVATDSSNIEPRVLCWIAGQMDLLAKFRLPKSQFDIYKDFGAHNIYFKAVADITALERTVAKSAVIGCGYLLGAAKFILYCKQTAGVTISEAEAQQAVQGYRQGVPQIQQFWNACRDALECLANRQDFAFGVGARLFVNGAEQSILLPSGRKLWYRGMAKRFDEERGRDVFVYKRRKGKSWVDTYLHPGLLTENIVQAIARDIVMWQAVKISQRYPVVGTVHDEIVFLASSAEAKDAVAWSITTMSIAPSWATTLPLSAEGGHAPNYGDA